MTNFEFYADEIKAVEYDFAYGDGKVSKCSCYLCGEKCIFYDDDKDCETNKIEWLYSEHKEQPMLTQNERKLCEILNGGYIARDSNKILVYNEQKPTKYNKYWVIAESYTSTISDYMFNDCNSHSSNGKTKSRGRFWTC